MLVTANPQQTLWETILPPGYQDLPTELAAVDELLDDPAFFEPYRVHFSPLLGRPSIPDRDLSADDVPQAPLPAGYETLCREVADSICWSKPPGRKWSGWTRRALTPRWWRRMARIHNAGAASQTTVRDRRRAAGRRARSISAHLKLRNDEAKATVLAITGGLADLAETTITDASRVLVNAPRHPGWAGLFRPRPTRLVSLHDPDARPIAKGRLGKPVEFGYTVQFTDNTGGIVLDYSVHQGNPADAPLLAPAIARVKGVFGKAPGAVTADRGYGEAKVDEALTDLGVATVVIPRKGKPSAARRRVEHGRGFRRLVKWRTGAEGRISYLKRSYGLDRTLLDGLTGARTWCGLGVLTHNSVKIAHLIEARRAASACGPTRRGTTATADTAETRGPAPRHGGQAATGPPTREGIG